MHITPESQGGLSSIGQLISGSKMI